MADVLTEGSGGLGVLMVNGVPVVWRNNFSEGYELGVGVVEVMLLLVFRCDGDR